MTPTPRQLVTSDGQVVNGEAFTDWIGEYPKGQLGLELSEALAEYISATQLHGKSSTFTLKVTMAPGEGFYGELLVKTQVTSTPAKAAAPAAAFFPTPTGGLSRRDPNQAQLPGTETP